MKLDSLHGCYTCTSCVTGNNKLHYYEQYKSSDRPNSDIREKLYYITFKQKSLFQKIKTIDDVV